MDEKKSKPQDNQPPAKVGQAQEHVPDVMGEGDKILGMTKENSGWDVYNNEARKVDTELAAIFAAVLIAFIIESKKMLEQDPTETMVDVMIFYTNNVANGTHSSYNRTEFEASTPAIIVNSLFFGSLSASLLAALASVVALQWVADYDAAITCGGSSPEDRAKRRQFRYAGMVWWKMSEIIAALPLLLYFSVMLFFAGLILWMWDTNHTVGVVVAGGTAIAILFYVTSTMIAVAFVSAPFRTPLSRWIYTLCHLPISALYWLMWAMCISTIPEWIKTRHSLVITSYRREDRAVESTETLGRDALIWLANQISISQDSYRRLLFLVGELPSLKTEHLPTFASTEALWYRIFDLLGWRHFSRGSSAVMSVEERRRGMEILQQCYQMPVIQKLVDSVERKDLTDFDYWSRYCDLAEDSQWSTNLYRPNHLFLLLRDIPCPVTFSAQEIDVTTQLSQWRNRAVKEPEVWEGLIAVADSLHPEFFSSCVTTLGSFCIHQTRLQLREQNRRQVYISTVRKVVQIAVLHNNLLPTATIPLIRAYEALLTRFRISANINPPCIEAPFRYGRALSLGSADDHATHASIILLLSRQIRSTPDMERAVKVRDIITLLWLRPSHSVLRNWDYLREIHGRNMDAEITSDWIKHADSIPHVLEIFRHLATAQKADPIVGPLWRTVAANQANDPHFVEAFQTFDRLMETDCSDDDHRTLINLVCQDLEQESYPDFDDYFTRSRLDSLILLKDPCLKALVGCARGPDFLSHTTVPEAYGKARRSSLTRVAKHIYERFSSIDSPAVLQGQASLWPMNPNQAHLYQNAMHDTTIFNFLRRMFKYPVLCLQCLDGPGHLAAHLLFIQRVEASQKVTLLGKIPLEGRYMRVPLIILSSLFDGDTPSLVDYLPRAAESIRRTLEEDIKEIVASQFHLLVMIWNTAKDFVSGRPVDVRAILVGIHKALRLSYDSRSTHILAPLSRKILRLIDGLSFYEAGTFAERELFIEEATKVGDLLLTNLAVRSIFGRHNSHRIACARAVGDVQPAVDWLAPYEV